MTALAKALRAVRNLGCIALLVTFSIGCASTPKNLVESSPPRMFDSATQINSALAMPGSEALEFIRFKNRAFVLKGGIWSNPYIVVCWEDGVDPLSTEAAWVHDAITRTWQAYSGLTFASWTTCGDQAQGIRIRVEDTGPHTKGLGRQLNGIRNGMVLNFSFANWSPACQRDDMRRFCIESIAVHEFGHAIGFAHEQNRHDTPGECALRRQGGDGDLLLTPYDRDSVMNYCNAKYNNNGLLSEYDKKAVAEIYPKR